MLASIEVDVDGCTTGSTRGAYAFSWGSDVCQNRFIMDLIIVINSYCCPGSFLSAIIHCLMAIMI